MTGPNIHRLQDETIVVLPVGCCNRTCLHLIVAGLSAHEIQIIRQMEDAYNLPLERAFLALRERTVEATNAFDSFGRIAQELEAAKVSVDLQDKVDRKGRRESQTHFFDKLPRRKRR